MSLLDTKIMEGAFTPEQKEDMIRKLTDTMGSAEGGNMRPARPLVIDEVSSCDRSVGGNASTTGDVKAPAAGRWKT